MSKSSTVGKNRPYGLVETLREIAVVTVGILLAFALNAWWDGVKSATEEQQVLNGLQEDFKKSQAGLERIVLGHKRSEKALRILLDSSGAPTSSFPADSFRVLLLRGLSIRTYDPQTGTVDALLASGRLSIIENKELRAMLSAWPSALADYQEDERWAREWSFNQARPRLGRVAILPWTEPHVGDRYPIDQQKILSDIESLNLLAHQLVLTRGVLRGAELLKERITRIQETVQQALSN